MKLNDVEVSTHSTSIEDSLISQSSYSNRRRHNLSEILTNESKKAKDSYRFISMAVLTCTMMLAEIFTGIFTGSLTLLSDALHMFSDLIALMVGFAAHHMANSSNDKHTSSQNPIVFMRYEIVGALINGTILLTSCFIMALEAIKRIAFFNEPIENVDYVLIVGGLGLFINLIGLVIFGHDHTHSHSHSHSNNHDHKETNLNIRAVFLHILGDLLGSIAVMFVALIIKFTDGWWNLYIDPVCTLVIVVIISCSAIPLVKQSAYILLDKSPFELNVTNQLVNQLKNVSGVLNVHELNCWQIKCGYYVATVHLIIDPNWKDDGHSEMYCKNECSILHDKMTIVDRCKVLLHKYGIHSSNIQTEYPTMGNKDWEKGEDPCFDYICYENDCITKSKAFASSKV